MHLFCLPYAGGGAALYRGWQSAMPIGVDVVPLHLPGRGTKHQQVPLHDWQLLVDHLIDELLPTVRQPFAFFGHSMGALIALELSFALRDRCGVQPAWFGASGCAAPSVRQRSGGWLERSEAQLLEEIRGLAGTPAAVLDEPELLQLVLPGLRADFHLCGTYEHRARHPLRCPVTVFAGATDATTRDPATLAAWSREVSGAFMLRRLAGDHFFINTASCELATVVGQELRRLRDA